MSHIRSDEPVSRLHPANANVEEQGEFIDLSQIFAAMRRNWGTLAACVLLAILCGGALFAVVPARWQALTTIEIGQVPLGTPISGSREVALIEPPPQAAERLKQRDLINAALKSMAIPVDQPDDERAALLRSTLKPTVIKNTNFVQLGVAGYSPEEARNSLAAVTRALVEAHDKLMAPVLDRMKAQLEDNARQMAEAERERTRLKEILTSAEKANSKVEFAPTIVAVNQLGNKDAQIHQFIAERAALEDMLADSRTYPTRAIDSFYVNPRPYFPKLSLFLGLAAILGLFVGAGLALYRDRKKAARSLRA